MLILVRSLSDFSTLVFTFSQTICLSLRYNYLRNANWKSVYQTGRGFNFGFASHYHSTTMHSGRMKYSAWIICSKLICQSIWAANSQTCTHTHTHIHDEYVRYSCCFSVRIINTTPACILCMQSKRNFCAKAQSQLRSVSPSKMDQTNKKKVSNTRLQLNSAKCFLFYEKFFEHTHNHDAFGRCAFWRFLSFIFHSSLVHLFLCVLPFSSSHRFPRPPFHFAITTLFICDRNDCVQ